MILTNCPDPSIEGLGFGGAISLGFDVLALRVREVSGTLNPKP